MEYLKKDITDYFELNKTPEINLPTIWGAFKVVIRSRLIKWNSVEKRRRNEANNQIQKEILTLEMELKKKPG